MAGGPVRTTLRDGTRAQSLKELAVLFLRLGTTAFGGPAAHLAMMEDEVVRRRRWLTRDEFLDLVGATQLIPGPNSTELAIHIGRRRAGGWGLLVAGTCFIVPATLMVATIAWAYLRFGRLPAALALLASIKPVILAIIAQALWRLARTAVKNVALGGIGLVALACGFGGVHELVVLFGCGVAALATQGVHGRRNALPGFVTVGAVGSAAGGSALAITPPTGVALWPLFLFFAKVGSVLFGSGYVLLAFLRADLVERWHWLNESQLLDAIAVGQVTPGPVFTTATFIGYVLAGTPGAAVATVGIFLPAFVFVAISGPVVPRLRRSRTAGAILDGVNVGSLALMTLVTCQLTAAAVVDVWSGVLAIGAAIVLFRWRVNSTWLVAAGAASGIVRIWLG